MIRRVLGFAACCVSLCACGIDDAPVRGVWGGDAATLVGTIRGRLTDAVGAPIADVVVRAEGVEARTDANGRFDLGLMKVGEARVSVADSRYSESAVPVNVREDHDAHVELSALRRRSVTLDAAEKGGRVESTDGFAVELPAKALATEDGKPVSGPVEVRYALIDKSALVAAAPGRLQVEGAGALDGYGMVEVQFYQGARRLALGAKANVEVPLVADHGLTNGKQVDGYTLGDEDKRWRSASPAVVAGNKVVVQVNKRGWFGAAAMLPVDSCVSGRLTKKDKSAAASTTIRAARARGLSLVQADTGDDGSFCLPVTPDDDWRVSAYYDDGADGLGLTVDVNSADAAGMCGGSGCKKVGDVELPALAR